MIKVMCHGTFDLLHIGHIRHLEEAKKLGDHLIVSVTSDRHVNKGPKRPYFNELHRMEALKGLSFVDEVVLSDSDLAVDSIEKIKPNVFVKGIDYENGESKFNDDERRALERVGAKLIFTKTEKHSSSEIINQFIWSDEQKETIEKVKSLGGMTAITQALSEIKEFNISILGEAIIDQYTFVDINGVSNKRPTLSTKLQYSKLYEGGSLAVRNHLKPFVKSIQYPDCNMQNTIIKTRYLHEDKHLFEVVEEVDNKKSLLPEIYGSNAVILCDFGHGLFDSEMVDWCAKIPYFIAINCQTNSSNYGFNLATKYKDFDFSYLSIDLKEARLALHDQNPTGVYEKIKAMMNVPSLSITLGKGGAIVDGYHVPAFADTVVDPMGAGDAYFALTSLLVNLELDPTLIGFMGNVFAGLKTKTLGNEPVGYDQFIKALNYILK